MQTLRSIVVALCVLSILLLSDSSRAENKEPEKVLRHAVFFKFKDGTSKEDVQKVVDAFDGLPKKIDTIKDYQRGTNSEPEQPGRWLHALLSTDVCRRRRTSNVLAASGSQSVRCSAAAALGQGVCHRLLGPGSAGGEGASTEARSVFEVQRRYGAEQVKEVEDAIAKLPSQCETVKAFEWGKNNSPEKHDEGFTHCFMFTFDNPEGVKAYGDEPAHKAVVEKLKATAEKARVLDFWTK